MKSTSAITLRCPPELKSEYELHADALNMSLSRFMLYCANVVSRDIKESEDLYQWQRNEILKIAQLAEAKLL